MRGGSSFLQQACCLALANETGTGSISQHEGASSRLPASTAPGFGQHVFAVENQPTISTHMRPDRERLLDSCATTAIMGRSCMSVVFQLPVTSPPGRITTIAAGCPWHDLAGIPPERAQRSGTPAVVRGIGGTVCTRLVPHALPERERRASCSHARHTRRLGGYSQTFLNKEFHIIMVALCSSKGMALPPPVPETLQRQWEIELCSRRR